MEQSEFLEPRLSLEQSRERVIHSFLTTKPEISNLGRSSVLDQVKSFLPTMATADKDLKTAIKNGLGEKLNVENVQEDEKYIEMDVAVLDDGDTPWTSDSEADSTPSQSENDFTSDSDISSSSACSSSSCTSSTKSTVRNKSQKRPLVEDISEPAAKSTRTES
ncbi:uncharacterized protein C12orf45 homolog [Eurytemora carolleeae]|uniref:uncharacterized protein C12orf45 homolog n=1 Tax=Eurytemora carolleeae TaxID=1294199 RepID=UPI000C77E044|nr:uncharacterized protein C12orf45 homolog [Eurytemora carolleeae]|eukprot:XP_023320036.1 uncharacterized protein C12orf45 homolog [Eurytemora affinis]